MSGCKAGHFETICLHPHIRQKTPYLAGQRRANLHPGAHPSNHVESSRIDTIEKRDQETWYANLGNENNSAFLDFSDRGWLPPYPFLVIMGRNYDCS
jgi:hypothetical protein